MTDSPIFAITNRLYAKNYSRLDDRVITDSNFVSTWHGVGFF